MIFLPGTLNKKTVTCIIKLRSNYVFHPSLLPRYNLFSLLSMNAVISIFPENFKPRTTRGMTGHPDANSILGSAKKYINFLEIFSFFQNDI